MYKFVHPRGNGGQWICGIIVAFSGFTSGLGIAWASIFFPKVESGEVGRTFSLMEESFIASLAQVGQLVAVFPSGFIQSKVGRRCSLLICNPLQLCAWTLIFLSRTFWAILLARLFIGIWSGFIVTCCPPYMAEISSAVVRGRLSALLSIFFTIGLVFQTSVGAFISYDAVAITSFCITFIHALALLNIPESPYSLLRFGKIEQAEKNLKWLRGNEDIDEIFNHIKLNLDAQMSRKSGYKQIFKGKISRKAFLQAFRLIMVQRFTGFMALVAFSSKIFPEDWFILKADKYPMVWNLVILTFLLVSFCMFDHVDHHILLMISSAFCALFGIILVIWFYLYEKTNLNMSGTIWIPYMAMSLYAASYSTGLYFIPIIFIGEIFPMNIKSEAICLIIFLSFIAGIIIVQSFLPMKTYLGMFGNFAVYTTSALVGCYVCTRTTETRNRSLENIQNKLERVSNETQRKTRK